MSTHRGPRESRCGPGTAGRRGSPKACSAALQSSSTASAALAVARAPPSRREKPIAVAATDGSPMASPGACARAPIGVTHTRAPFGGGDPDARGGVESASASRASTRKSKLLALRQTLVSSVARELPHEERPAKLPPLGTGVGAPVRALSRRSREGSVVRRHPWTGAIRGPAPSVVRHHPGCARTRRPAAHTSLERSRGPRHRLAARSRRHHRVVRRRAERSAWARRRTRGIWPAASSDEKGACGGAVRS